MDITQWKFKIYSTIFQYGPTWEKRLDIQKELRELNLEELQKGTRAIHNSALNPQTEPSTNALQELTFINQQNTTNYTKSKMDAFGQLWELLDTDVTGEFINKFQKCFKQFVRPEKPLLYVTEEEEDEE